eukprot:COSAG06_NODE_1156_length_10478_cov_5.792177_6_plen_151_part_00
MKNEIVRSFAKTGSGQDALMEWNGKLNDLDSPQADLATLADVTTATTFEDTVPSGGNADRSRLLTEITDAKTGVESVRDGIQVRQTVCIAPRFSIPNMLALPRQPRDKHKESSQNGRKPFLLHPAFARCHDHLRDHCAKIMHALCDAVLY